MDFDIINTSFSNIWLNDRNFNFLTDSKMALIGYFTNYLGDLVIGDSSTYTSLSGMVGMFNDDTINNLKFDPSDADMKYDNDIYLGFCSPFFNVLNSNLTSLKLINMYFEDNFGYVDKNSLADLAAIIGYEP